jgi:hypothetical protein
MVSPKGKLADPIWPDSKDLSLHRLLMLAFPHDVSSITRAILYFWNSRVRFDADTKP